MPASMVGQDVDLVTKQMSGIFSLVRPKVDVISEDIALAGQQMGELLLRRIARRADRNAADPAGPGNPVLEGLARRRVAAPSPSYAGPPPP